jgi:glycine/D-amino acid oxidase-like deaminating enzyme
VATRVVVVGAGAFGGWSALWLRRRGFEVTLFDAWGPGNSRASSGGETRIIRGLYGGDAVHVRLAARALQLWKEHDARWNTRLFHPTRALWMFRGDDAFARTSLPHLEDAGLTAHQLSIPEARAQFPQIDFEDIRTAYLEQDAGYLEARRASVAVVERFVAEGGTYRQLAAKPGRIAASVMESAATSDGSSVLADRYLFATGPWLGTMFPDVVGTRVQPTRQEVFFFGTPAGDTRFLEFALPVWFDFGDTMTYGIPGNVHRGMKVADDTHGPVIDPTTLDRSPSGQALAHARRALAHRFPALGDAPLVESRVCQYENTPDGRFILDRHPAADNVWLLGGGSGHGFKMGPAIGEEVARLIGGETQPTPLFRLSRLPAI